MRPNKKLNTVPLLISDLRVGNILMYAWAKVVVTALEYNRQLVQIEYVKYDFSSKTESFIQEIIPLDRLHGEEMWSNESPERTENILKSFGFEALKRDIYRLYIGGISVWFNNIFRMEDFGFLQMYDASIGEDPVFSKKVWYTHELQNAVYLMVDEDLMNSTTARIMTTSSKPGSSPDKLLSLD